jgi:hypothetical protein
MIIRPPQQGQRRAGETSSAGLSASLRGLGRILSRGEQLSGALDVVRTHRAGEQAVVTDAVSDVLRLLSD